jgi:arginyl-tRNA synthetase
MISQELFWALYFYLPQVLLAHKDAILKDSKTVTQDGLSSSLWKDQCQQCYFVPPPSGKEGHYATNAPFILGKYLGLPPQEVHPYIVQVVEKHTWVEKAVFSPPGFVNIFLKKDYWITELQKLLLEKDLYGKNSFLEEENWKNFGKSLCSNESFHGASPQDHNTQANILPQKWNLEFVSVNPTGPLHPGHGRGAVFGDALANLLSSVGLQVTKEYYVNDAGVQADLLGRSVYWYYKNFSEEKDSIQNTPETLPKDFYQGGYIQKIAQDLREIYGSSLEESEKGSKEFWLPEVRDFAINKCMAWIKEDLKCLNIHHDVFSSEKNLQETGAVDRMVEALKEKNLVYEGVLDKPKSYTGQEKDGESNEQLNHPISQSLEEFRDGQKEAPLLLFKGTEFGDDQDRPLTKKDGSWTYFAGDIAYHLDKLKRGFHKLIDVWGADHGGHVQRIQGALKALTRNGESSLEVLLCQMVRFKSQDALIKMSKRSGNFITLREVVEAIGKDAFRFFMLTKKLDAHMDFDFQKVQEQTKDNPLFYIQYAHARCASVLRSAERIFTKNHLYQWLHLDFSSTSGEKFQYRWTEDPFMSKDIVAFLEPPEYKLLELITDFPRQVYQSAKTLEPHRISTYLYELSREFHSLWSQGSGKETLRFLLPTDPLRSRKGLCLVQGTKYVIGAGLRILGVTPLEELSSQAST